MPLAAIQLAEGKLYLGDPSDVATGGVDQGWLDTTVKDSDCMPGGDILNSTGTERVGPNLSPTIVVNLPVAGSDLKI